MEYQQGRPRQELTLYTTFLDDMIPQDDSVCLIDQL